jgi:hypothetical protein
MKRSLLLVFGALGLFLSSGHGALFILSGTMDPQQAGTNGGFGAGTGSGNGTISGSFDDSSKELSYTITWQDLEGSVTNLHFHVGAPGVSGGVDLGVPSPFTSPKSVSSVTLNSGQESNLLAGLWYANVHTSSFGGGEIRGQVNVAPVPEPSRMALMMTAVVGMGFRRRRTR